MSALPERVVECFNTGAATPLAGLCDRRLTVYGSLFLAPPPRGALIDEDPLGTLIKAFRAVFGDLRIRAENVEESESGYTFQWRGTGTYADSDDGKSTVVKINGAGRIHLENDKIKYLWFTTDDYNVLMQLGRICADPGKAIGRAEEINGAALGALVRAIETGDSVDDSWQRMDLHSLLRTFVDLSKGFDTTDRRYEGRGKISVLVGKIREVLPLPIKVTVGEGISQGGTTSFRCRIWGADNRKYHMICSFSSGREGVYVLHLAIVPPVKLREMFT